MMNPSSRRVLFLSSSRDAWGAEESLLVLAKRFDPADIDCRLWTANPELRERWAASVGTSASLVGEAPSGPLKEVGRWTRYVGALRRDPGWRPDVVVVFNLGLAPLALFYRLRHRARPRFVLDLHDYLPTAKGRFKLAVLARAFDKVIAISTFSRSQLNSRSPRSVVLTRPIEPLATGVTTSGGRAIGIIGRLDPDKNIELAIESVGRVPDAHLSIRGSATTQNSEYAAELMSSARSRLGERVEFTGRVSNDTVLSDIDVLLVTNAREALGRTVLEAQLQGRVVVVPDEGGAAELVENEMTGFVYRANDPAAAADALERALSQGGAVREEARRFAAAVSNPERYAERYSDILKRCAQ